MAQSKFMSFIEAMANPVVGFVISVGITKLVFPLYGYEISVAKASEISLIFFVASVARSYIIRRWFNGFKFS